jgi:predicted transposase YdaD
MRLRIFRKLVQQIKVMGIIQSIRNKKNEEGLKEGEEKGREEEKTILVKNLITQLGLSDEQASEIAKVSLAFVQEIRTNITGSQK